MYFFFNKFNKLINNNEVLDRICLNSFFFLLFLFIFFIYSNFIIFCIEFLIFAHIFLRLPYFLNEYFVIKNKVGKNYRRFSLILILILFLILIYFQIFDNQFLNNNFNII